MDTFNNQNNYIGGAVMGGGMMGDKNYYNNLGPKNKPPTNSKADSSDLRDRQQGPNNMPDKPSQPAQRDPQEFADQKKEEVKQTYSTSHSDRINNAYRDHYGRNAHADEIANWTGTGMGIEDIQKGLKTSFARDGEHLTGDQLAALQIQQQQPEPTPTPTPEPTPEPTPAPTPEQPQQPEGPQVPESYTENENRFAGSDKFKEDLNAAKNIGNTTTSSPPNTAPSASQQVVTQTNPQDVFAEDSGTARGSINNQQELNKGRENVNSFLNNASEGYSRQLGRESQMRSQSPNTQDSTDFYKKHFLLQKEAQAGRSDGTSIANKYIQMGRDNKAVNINALDQNIREAPLYSGARAELEGLKVWGDRYRNSRENPVSWSGVTPPKGVERPDFQNIYNNTKDDIDSIKI